MTNDRKQRILEKLAEGSEQADAKRKAELREKFRKGSVPLTAAGEPEKSPPATKRDKFISRQFGVTSGPGPYAPAEGARKLRKTK